MYGRVSWVSLGILIVTGGCDSGEEEPPPESTVCIIDPAELSNSTAVDAIPAIRTPTFISPAEAAYLEDGDFVLGLILDDSTQIAVPHNILWWHEIVNINQASPRLSVTFCPLTGSGLAFDRSTVGGIDFGVSGLLWRNNNVIFDRTGFSLWSQMGAKAICGDAAEREEVLKPVALFEMTWAGWQAMYPETEVVSDETGFSRNYEVNPLGDYIEPANTTLFWPMPDPVDDRRLPKERVLGIPSDSSGITFPLAELEKMGEVAVVASVFEGERIVVFYDREKQAAAAFWLRGADDTLAFEIDQGSIVDVETGSRWQVDGLAIGGTLAGRRLTPIASSYVSYWFAWAAFQPAATLWTAE